MTVHMTMLDVGPCPDENLFVEMLQGALSAQERQEIDDHIDRCQACAALVIELGSMLEGEEELLSPSLLEQTRAQRPGASPPDHSPEPARVLGRYQVTRQVGVGGMGVVYEAHDPKLRRKVAVKLLRADLIDPEQRQEHAARLMREARLLASISHPHVLPVYDVGTWRDQVFMAMHFVEGSSLSDWVLRVEPDWRQVLEVYLQAGAGLASAHQCGLVHRDVKPDNIMLGHREGVWLTDFGLACNVQAQLLPPSPSERLEADAALDRSVVTRTGAVMGTPAFMSPEQYMGQEVTARSDQFSFCASLFLSIYGERPFEGDTVRDLESAVCAGRLKPPPSSQAPLVLYKLLAVGLALDPSQRHPSMEALLDKLRLIHTPPRRASRAPIWIGGLVALLALGAGVAVGPGAHYLGLEEPRTPKERCQRGDMDACEAWAVDSLNRHIHPSHDVVHDQQRAAFLEELGDLLPLLEQGCRQGRAAMCSPAAQVEVSLAQDPNDDDNSGGFPIGAQLPAFVEKNERGCQGGDRRACTQMVDIYGDALYESDKVHPIPASRQQLERFLAPWCDKGKGDMCWMLAEQSYQSAELPQDIPAHMTWLEKGCQAGHIPSCLYAGIGWWDGGLDRCQEHFNLVGRYMPNHFPFWPNYGREDVEEFCKLYLPFGDNARALGFLGKVCQGDQVNTPEGKAACALQDRIALQGVTGSLKDQRAGCAAHQPGACRTFAETLLQAYFEESNEHIDEDRLEDFRQITAGLKEPLDEACHERGEAEACTAAAFVYVLERQPHESWPRKENVEPFFAWMERACRLGSWRGCGLIEDLHGLGLYKREGYPPQPERFLEILGAGCQAGSEHACWLVAEAYYFSFHLKHDMKQCVHWLERACEQGHPLSCGLAAAFWWDAPAKERAAFLQRRGEALPVNAILFAPDEEEMEKWLKDAAPFKNNQKALALASRGCSLPVKHNIEDADTEGGAFACTLRSVLAVKP